MKLKYAALFVCGNIILLRHQLSLFARFSTHKNASHPSKLCTELIHFVVQHIMVDLGTGNNNKINWAMNDKQEFIDIVEVVYRGARKGRGLVVSPKGEILMVLPSL
jgi:hypothetical protein